MLSLLSEKKKKSKIGIKNKRNNTNEVLAVEHCCSLTRAVLKMSAAARLPSEGLLVKGGPSSVHVPSVILVTELLTRPKLLQLLTNHVLQNAGLP